MFVLLPVVIQGCPKRQVIVMPKNTFDFHRKTNFPSLSGLLTGLESIEIILVLIGLEILSILTRLEMLSLF